MIGVTEGILRHRPCVVCRRAGARDQPRTRQRPFCHGPRRRDDPLHAGAGLPRRVPCDLRPAAILLGNSTSRSRALLLLYLPPTIGSLLQLTSPAARVRRRPGTARAHPRPTNWPRLDKLERALRHSFSEDMMFPCRPEDAAALAAALRTHRPRTHPRLLALRRRRVLPPIDVVEEPIVTAGQGLGPIAVRRATVSPACHSAASPIRLRSRSPLRKAGARPLRSRIERTPRTGKTPALRRTRPALRQNAHGKGPSSRGRVSLD